MNISFQLKNNMNTSELVNLCCSELAGLRGSSGRFPPASPNQVLTHAARAAAKQLNKLSATSGGRARRARRALVRATLRQ